jgi:hypothetical protein
MRQMRAVPIASSRDVSDPRTGPGVRVRVRGWGRSRPGCSPAPVRRAAKDAALRAFGTDATVARNAKVLQEKTVVAYDGDPRPQTDVIEANRRACLRGYGRPGSISPSTSPESRWVVIARRRLTRSLVPASNQPQDGIRRRTKPAPWYRVGGDNPLLLQRLHDGVHMLV